MRRRRAPEALPLVAVDAETAQLLRTWAVEHGVSVESAIRDAIVLLLAPVRAHGAIRPAEK